MNKTTTFFTKNDEKNLRLDKLLTIKLKTITRSQIKKIIDSGDVKVNNKETVSTSQKIKVGSKIEILFKDKINPYMQPLFDNLKFIKNQFGEKEKKYRKIEEMEDLGKLKISALAFIRGRSLSNVIFIVDEAQNLTPHEVKTIITRAGENTKIIFTGDVFQIDTPYLDEQSNGLSYLIDRLKGNDLFAHITLEKGERSELANLANELL